MNQVVFLRLENGDFTQGFRVTLNIGEKGKPLYIIGVNGFLRPAPEIPKLYKEWQTKYCYLESDYRHRLHFIEDDATEREGSESGSSLQECDQAAERLKTSFQDWLKCDEFRPIEGELLTILNTSDQIQIILQTEDEQLRKLPWEVWNFFQRFPNSEFSISPLSSRAPKQYTPAKKVRILAILGNSVGIDTQKDRKVLENLPYADVYFLIQPTRKEFNSLWSTNWDILFFAGHSSSNGEDGCIYINQTDEGGLEISELKETLKTAIAQGLKLAIFNSCDGLGLARQLEKLHIPQVIVMREAIPDVFAHEFLKYFLTDFSHGISSYAAVRNARMQLRELDKIDQKFPGASWLPVVCQNLAAKDFVWPSPQRVRWRKVAQHLRKHSPTVIISGLVGMAIAVVIFHPSQQSLCPANEKIEADNCVKILPKTPLVIGFLGFPHQDVKPNEDNQYLALKSYLKQKLGNQVKDILFEFDEQLSAYQMQSKIVNKEFDIVFAHSPMNSWVAKNFGYIWLGSDSPYSSSSYRSVLFVRKDSHIQSIADIKPTTKVFLGNVGSASSFYVPVYELHGKSLSVTQVNSHEKIQELVKTGKADVGASIESYVEQEPELRIIHRSQPIPVAGVFISPKLSKSDQNQIKQVFRQIPQEIKNKVNYKEIAEVNYDYIKQIFQKTDQILECADLNNNPVQLFCNR